MTFDDVIGNELVVENLKHSVEKNKLLHAYIFDGEKGMGKKLISKLFAKSILCENRCACEKCYSCLAFDNNNHPDVVYVSPEKTKFLGVDDIREQVNAIVGIKPYKSLHKIFIIEDADKMSTAAQNAILKTLEEAPSYAMFLLLSSNYNNFLPTILSRCVIIKLRALSDEKVKHYLVKNFNLDNQLANLYSAYSNGNIGRAVELIQNENFINLRNEVLEILYKLSNKNLTEALMLEKKIENFKDNIHDVIDIIFIWYADLITVKFSDNVHNFDKLNEIQTASQNNNLSDLIFKLNSVINAKKYLLSNTNFKLTMDVLLINLIGEYLYETQ